MGHHEMPGIPTVKRLMKRGKESDTQNKLSELNKRQNKTSKQTKNNWAPKYIIPTL